MSLGPTYLMFDSRYKRCSKVLGVLFSCPIIIFCSKHVMSCIVLYVSFLEFEFLKVKRCLINEIVSTLIFLFWHNFISECDVCGTTILTSDIETSKILFSPGYRKSFYLDFSWGVLRLRINWVSKLQDIVQFSNLALC